jgi:hypothetical protein
MSEQQGFTTAELRQAMKDGYAAIIAFVTSEVFAKVSAELDSLSDIQRDNFVRNVILNRGALERRGVNVPEGILLQRSSFGDRRPTLFCIKKYLPERFHGAWENVNLTFDMEFPDYAVARDPETSWRTPISPDIQSLLLAAGLSLEQIPDRFQVRKAFMGEPVAQNPSA